MTRLRGEYVYAQTGRMRPVFLQPDCVCARFCLEHFSGDRARVEVSHDPRAVLEKGRACWLPYEGGDGGGIYGATALRVVVEKVDGWMTMVLEQELNGGEGHGA